MGVVLIPILGAIEPQDLKFRLEPDTNPVRTMEGSAMVAPETEALTPNIGSTRGDVTDSSGVSSISVPSGADKMELVGNTVYGIGSGNEQFEPEYAAKPDARWIDTAADDQFDFALDCEPIDSNAADLNQILSGTEQGVGSVVETEPDQITSYQMGGTFAEFSHFDLCSQIWDLGA